MPVPDVRFEQGRIPDGYMPVPISDAQRGSPVRLCVLVRAEPDPVAGHLVQVRTLVDARVYLGCVTDAAGIVHEWVEVWVQTMGTLAESLPAYRESLTNLGMEERWRQQVAAMDRLERPVVYRTGWEGMTGGLASATSERPAVTFLDVAKREAVHPLDKETGDRWTLCTDDKMLGEAGLAPFGLTLHRYLYLPKLGADSVFVPVTPGAPAGANMGTMADVTAGRPGLIPFNVGSGLMLVRTLGPIGLADHVDLLSGGNWQGQPHGRSSVDMGLTAGPLGTVGGTARINAGFDGGLFLGQQGRWGRLIESFHLKLRALADAVGAVRSLAEHAQRPLLNITAESFQVRIGEPARGLPHLWSARVTLADPGNAIALPIKASDARYYVLPGAGEMSIYRPQSLGVGAAGVGTVRIREVLTKAGEDTVLEGTLATDERIEATKNDLVWLHLPLGGGRVDLYARLESDTAMAKGEWRFRTIQQRHSPEEYKALVAAKGVPLPSVAFEVVPLLSTPCDLYSLGVLAVRVLLAGEKSALPIALDEVLSLAKQAAAEHDESVSLETRIGAIFGRDKRWATALGPQLLTDDDIGAAEAMDLIPSSLWWETLAAVVRMFAGIGPDSECKDWGDARMGAAHLVFDRAVSDLEALLRKTRSLIVIDWNYNREIHAVIRQYLVQQGAGGSGGKAPAR